MFQRVLLEANGTLGVPDGEQLLLLPFEQGRLEHGPLLEQRRELCLQPRLRGKEHLLPVVERAAFRAHLQLLLLDGLDTAQLLLHCADLLLDQEWVVDGLLRRRAQQCRRRRLVGCVGRRTPVRPRPRERARLSLGQLIVAKKRARRREWFVLAAVHRVMVKASVGRVEGVGHPWRHAYRSSHGVHVLVLMRASGRLVLFEALRRAVPIEMVRVVLTVLRDLVQAGIIGVSVSVGVERRGSPTSGRRGRRRQRRAERHGLVTRRAVGVEKEFVRMLRQPSLRTTRFLDLLPE